MEGWIKLYRTLLDDPISRKPNYLAVWIYLIINANHKDIDTIWNNKKTTIKKGSFIGSISKIAKHFNLSSGTVTYILNYLEVENKVEKESTQSFTLFKVKNYCRYQEVENKVENELTTDEKRIDDGLKQTINNKNDKNENKNNLKVIGESPSPQFGNQEINDLLLALKKKIGIDDFADSEKWERIFGKHHLSLLNKLGKEEYIRRLDLLMDDNFKSRNMNRIKYVYNEIKGFIDPRGTEEKFEETPR